MNELENKMLTILKELKYKNKFLVVKADFEAEGTRIFELLNLCNILHKADVKLAVKIGGCEAVFDFELASQFRPDIVISPMIESVFALKKFKNAKDRIYGKEPNETVFFVNIETKTAVSNIDEILREAKGFISGVTLGRVDLSSSLNLKRKDIDSYEVLKSCSFVSKKAKEAGFIVGVGGGFKLSSFCFLQKIAYYVDRIETRKFIFNFSEDFDLFKYNILKATEFELLYIENKVRYYRKLEAEDEKRIELLKGRIKARI